MFSILNKTSMLEDNCFYSSLPAEAITTAILKYASFNSLCCRMNEIVKSFKQTVFLVGLCAVTKLTTSTQSAVFQP